MTGADRERVRELEQEGENFRQIVSLEADGMEWVHGRGLLDTMLL